jgi:ATP-binding cassette, subfamily C (CFTR/MRP), member 1
MIYDKTLRLSISTEDTSSATTLMSADVERIVIGLRSIHDIWANVIQVGLATWLLERQVGVAIVGPLVLAAVCGLAALKVGQASVGQQMDWLGKIGKRITVTTEAISSIQSLKMLGLTGVLMELIQHLRVVELRSAGLYRRWEVGALVAGFFPILISPVLTFAVFITASEAEQKPLDASRMFVSLSYLSLMSQPLSMLFQCGPQVLSMVGCFGRIDEFLGATRNSQVNTGAPSISSNAPSRVNAQPDADSAEAVRVLARKVLASIRNGTFGWNTSQPVLHDINLTLHGEQLVLVVGPVGCGKSTLLKGLLRETPWSEGSVEMPPSVAYCDQTPWMVNGTLRENIVMFSDEDEELYGTILRACALQADLNQFPEGDATIVGSRGRTLSGGQKQRVVSQSTDLDAWIRLTSFESIARAIFARRTLNILDDVLSGLDATTEMHVFSSLFGPQGILRNRGTTVLATNAGMYLHDGQRPDFALTR